MPVMPRPSANPHPYDTAVRMTVTLTADSVDQLIPLALAVAERYPACRLLHIEPSWESGRSLSTGMKSPDPERFRFPPGIPEAPGSLRPYRS